MCESSTYDIRTFFIWKSMLRAFILFDILRNFLLINILYLQLDFFSSKIRGLYENITTLEAENGLFAIIASLSALRRPYIAVLVKSASQITIIIAQ